MTILSKSGGREVTESLSTVVRMPLATFKSWISDGICRLPLTELVPSDDDVFVQLLPKYLAQLSAGRQVTALVDEVVAVTQLTAASTKELAILLHNLNESWVPVHYFPLTLSIVSSNTPVVRPWLKPDIQGPGIQSRLCKRTLLHQRWYHSRLRR